ncbi:hypothetical protein INR77_07615 [Erythrobacter sp. SCSIO 43205]|uniref:hypothetical protein n=1 Tax=Erythrobacter sp. SCSIO 43205 TaxID=2779361 RepID=UPI001CA7CD64|nr:hypothetical protein [Erythrobacter sp. SCSIO 43205]UAB79515.1 hypothetical protein INR77_07615 [Erythrobacter sp. SCSIO 43205]
MIKAHFSFAIAGLGGLLLGACASADGRYPSLAVRDAERMTGQFAPAAPEQPAVPEIVSPQDVSDLVALAYETQEKFGALRPTAARLAQSAGGTGVESDRRSQALVAVAELTSLRGQTALVLARLDALEAEARTTFAPVQAIATGQAQTATLLQQQDEVLDSLSEMLAQ